MNSQVNCVIHLCPRHFPDSCGVGDYADATAREMQSLFNVRTATFAIQKERYSARWISVNPDVVDAGGKMSVDGIPSYVSAIENELALRLDCSDFKVACVLNYSGYGYSADGAPQWLLDLVKALKKEKWFQSLAIFFHESFATGYPWERCFWYTKRQKRIVGELASVADLLLTNRPSIVEKVKCASGIENDVKVIAVPSNVGEMKDVKCWSGRLHRVVLFGGVSRRTAWLNRGAKILIDFCKVHQIDEIVDIGSKISVSSLLENMVTQTGVIPGQAVSDIFADARFGFLVCNRESFTKSGVISAFRAHGVVPVVMVPSKKCKYGILSPDLSFLEEGLGIDYSLVSKEHWLRYKSHDIKRHASAYQPIMSN